MERQPQEREPIFVTGATGYVGAHVVRAAGGRWPLRCLVRTAPAAIPGVEWVVGDLTADDQWVEKMRGCRGVLHLATVSLAEAESDAARSENVVIGGLRRLMDAAIDRGLTRWWITSTTEVYGAHARLPISETSPLEPSSYYGVLKAAADLYAAFRTEVGRLDCTILRLSNLYGAAADGALPKTVLPRFAHSIVRDEPIVLHKSRENSRDFLHVRDAASAILMAIEHADVSGIINVASGEEVTLEGAAVKLAQIAARRLRIDFRPDEGRSRRVRIDTDRARALLGFSPQISFEHGLEEILRETLRSGF